MHGLRLGRFTKQVTYVTPVRPSLVRPLFTLLVLVARHMSRRMVYYIIQQQKPRCGRSRCCGRAEGKTGEGRWRQLSKYRGRCSRYPACLAARLRFDLEDLSAALGKSNYLIIIVDINSACRRIIKSYLCYPGILVERAYFVSHLTQSPPPLETRNDAAWLCTWK